MPASRHSRSRSGSTAWPRGTARWSASLPRARAKSNARWKAASLVVTVFTTSTSFIRGTGLKKCSPTMRSGRAVAAAIAAIVRLDVFEAKMVCCGQSASSSFHIPFLMSRSSITASISRSDARLSCTARQVSSTSELVIP